MEKYATIDIGSNSVLLLIAEKDKAGNWRLIVDKAETSRLGESLAKNGVLLSSAMDRTLQVLSDYRQIISDHKINNIAAVGTMALRNAKNANSFIEQAKKKFGITIEVITGQKEAQLSFIAVQNSINLIDKNIVVFDIGGGSTEFILGNNDYVEKCESVNIGVIRFTEQYLNTELISKSELVKVEKIIEQQLKNMILINNIDCIVGIGGTVTTLAAIKHQLKIYNPDIVHKTVIDSIELNRQIELFRSNNLEQRKQIVGLHPKRADVILAGAIITHVILKKFKFDSFIVSDRGLRYGLLIDRFGGYLK